MRAWPGRRQWCRRPLSVSFLPVTPGPALRFANFELLASERLLLRDGQPVPLRAKTFDLLHVLAERAGRLVTKDELLRLVWPDVIVEENNVATQIVVLRKVVGGELIATVPGRGYRFLGPLPAGRVDAAQEAACADAAPAPANRLVGRANDLLRVRGALERSPLVTIIGAGGVGKSTLARAAVAERDHVLWVELAPLRAADSLASAIVRASGTTPHSTVPVDLHAVLRPYRLLVFDNAEHLVDAVAGVATALSTRANAPRVLVTSQIALGLPGEQVERLDPLAVPGPGDGAGDDDDALALFIARVRAADSRHVLAPAAREQVRRICARLDGLPLAIEMAAARVPVLGLARVAEALDQRFVSLRQNLRATPERQRTLQAALDWSCGLLEPTAQRVFRALGVVSGTFPADLAGVLVGGDPWDAIDAVATLVDHSLVAVGHEEPPRLRLLETMRQYALARLREAGEEDAVRARHLDGLLALFRAAHDAVVEADEGQAQRRALAEIEQVDDAVTWALSHARGRALCLAACVSHVCHPTRWRLQGYRWLTSCAPFVDDAAITPAQRALWWRHYAAQSLYFGDAQALQRADAADQACRVAGETLHLVHVLCCRIRALPRGDVRLQLSIAEADALVGAHPQWPEAVRLLLLNSKALAWMREGRLADAVACGEAAFSSARQTRRPLWGFSAYYLSEALRLLGRRERARAVLEEVCSAPGDPADVSRMLAEAQRLRLLLVDEGASVLPACTELIARALRLRIAVPLGLLALGFCECARPRASTASLGLLVSLSGLRLDGLGSHPGFDAVQVANSLRAELGAAAFEAIFAAAANDPAPDLQMLVTADGAPAASSPA